MFSVLLQVLLIQSIRLVGFAIFFSSSPGTDTLFIECFRLIMSINLT